MKSVLSGTVRWFSPKRKYGFLTQKTDGSDLFFHLRNEKVVVIERTTTLEPIMVIRPPRKNSWIPEPGDQISYEISKDSKGRPCASSWVFTKNYKDIEKKIKVMPIYRLMYQVNDDPPTVEWQGFFPKYCPKTVYDHQKENFPFSCSDLVSQKWWEKKPQNAPDTKWEKCPYPLAK